MIGGKRRAVSGEQIVAQAFACLDHDLFGARDGIDREGDPRQLRLDHALDDHVHLQRRGIDAAAAAIFGDRVGVHRLAALAYRLLHLFERPQVQIRPELPRKRGEDAVLAGCRGSYGEWKSEPAYRLDQIGRRTAEFRHRKPGALKLEQHAGFSSSRPRRHASVSPEALHVCHPSSSASCIPRARSHAASPWSRGETRAPRAGSP